MKKILFKFTFLLMFVVASCSNIKGYPLDEVYKKGGGSGGGPATEDPVPVEAKAVTKSSFDEPLDWTPFMAKSVHCIDGFSPTSDPEVDEYGGWKIDAGQSATGFFRVGQIAGRWWFITPNGYPFIAKGLANFSFGSSERQIAARDKKFGGRDGWAKDQSAYLKDKGFNSVGGWSQTALISQMDPSDKIPYVVMYQPTSSYNAALKASGKEEEAYKNAGWEGYPNDFVMVFDPDLETYLESTLSAAVQYASDPYCMGYYVDNELPWKQYALEWCLTKWPATHVNHIKAQEWLDERKGRSGCTVADITEKDGEAYIAYCHGIYLEKVTRILRKYDANHLYFGCRYNHWRYELANDSLMVEAGKYIDVITLNHYRYWEPDPKNFDHWSAVSGRPIVVTEFYAKGDDFDLYYSDGKGGFTNKSGAGWLVHTQADRGRFYQNFVLNLLKSGGLIGWNWFTYGDSDPAPASAKDVDANRGIVTYEFEPYEPLVEKMEEINDNVYNLIRFYMKH